jgi:hypothetical protein
MAIRSAIYFSVMLLTALPALADRFTFSYIFATGSSITGTVDGTLHSDGNTVTGLHNLSAIYSPDPGLNLTFDTAFFDTFTLNAVGIQFAGFQGGTTGNLHPDFGFLFLDDGFPCPNCATVGTFQLGGSQISPPFGTDQLEAEPVNRSHWVAAIVAVPEPSAFRLITLLLAVLLPAARFRTVWNSRAQD